MDLSGYELESLREDTGLVLFRAHRPGSLDRMLVLAPASRAAEVDSVPRLEHEHALADKLAADWAIQPQQLARHQGRTVLLLKDPGGRPLEAPNGKSLDLKHLLQVAIGIASALRQMHARGLIHKDIKPANIFVDEAGNVRLTGFGYAAWSARERQMAAAPDVIAGSLQYMAPEQTGRMNRSIDNRSDLYALGVTVYEMLVGALPFTASDPLEWIYCHIARAPPPPSVRVEGIPPVLEKMILKLLEKNAEDRYQTAAGVEFDLRRCLAELQASQRIDEFALASRDLSDRLLIPEKLYGRETDIATLLAAFHQVATDGKFDFVLVLGNSGVGKSALVGELRRVLYSCRGLFAGGKVDRYKRDVPYATLAEAFRALVRHLLTQDDASLNRWRVSLQNALGGNGQLMVDLFPDLELMLGAQPILPVVSPQEAKNRFNLVFRRFVGVFAQPEHPLILFLDDLHWLDTATLDLLKLLASDGGVAHLLLVGACRADELENSPVLGDALASIGSSMGRLKEVRLAPLTLTDVMQLVAEALHTDAAAAEPLAALLLKKTQGNPFFVVQFLTTLNAEGLLHFDQVAGIWQWDMERIRLKGITDNLAELMAFKLSRFRGAALAILKKFACLGGGASTEILARVLGIAAPNVDAALREFVAAGLVHPNEDGYAFAHDGVREAAYALVPVPERAPAHLDIGRLLLQDLDQKKTDDRIFEIVSQLNRGESLIQSCDERRGLAALNLIAGKRAKEASAYDAALAYLDAGCELLTPESWSEDYQTAFELEFNRADCNFMLGDVKRVEERLATLAERCLSLGDLGRVVGRQVLLYGSIGLHDRGIELSVQCLQRMGIELPIHPGDAVVELEYRRFIASRGERPFESLLDLPGMQDLRWREVMDMLQALLTTAGMVNNDLQHLVALRVANISVQHGVHDETPHALSCIAGLILGWRFGTFDDAGSLARIAMRLVSERGLDRYAARLYAVISGTVGPWSMPLSECYEIAVRATDLGREQGGITYSAFAWGCRVTALLDSGKLLEEVHRQAESGLAFAEKIRFTLVAEFAKIALAFVRSLRGMTSQFGSFDSAGFDEQEREEYLLARPHLWHALVRYRIRKLQLQFYAGNLDVCMDLVGKLDGEVDSLRVFEIVEYRLFSALSRAAYLSSSEDPVSSPHFTALTASHEQLAIWAQRCPENFSDRACLVAAEIARLQSHELEAEQLFERAIRLARENGFTQNEALACELAAQFYAHRHFAMIAETYLRNARSCYLRWGADGKVRQLERLHPQLRDEVISRTSGTAAIGNRVHHLDLTAVVEMYQAVSREIVLDRLIEQLMVSVIEHGGAVRGLLLLPTDGEAHVVAEAVAGEKTVHINPRRPVEVAAQLAKSVLNYVMRTQEIVIIDDALEANPYAADPYILSARPRSVLCMPLVKQKRLVGVLYLENNLSSRTFTKDRLSILQLLASQAAISLENAELFLSIQKAQEEARRAGEDLRRSFDMIPALAWRASADGSFEFSNRQWHDYTGISEEAARTGTWIRAFHPADAEKVEEKWHYLLAYRTSGEFEARMRRFDGEYRSFLVRVTPMRDDRGNIVKWHGTNTDIENLKRAEKAQESLARVSRVTAMGALTVSIAHEVNQPLMAIVTNAATCLQWLNDSQLNIPEARKAAERIVRDGHRAGDVIASIRALARKAAPESVELDLNELILEVLSLTRNEIERHAISVETAFALDARRAIGDRIQMQQVILNLILNGIEAINATPYQPRSLSIVTKREAPGLVCVAVSDTGIGIEQAGSEQIFDAFFTTKADGIGIGLSICRTIVEAHRGRLWASPNDPQGTVFQFTVPAAEAERPH